MMWRYHYKSADDLVKAEFSNEHPQEWRRRVLRPVINTSYSKEGEQPTMNDAPRDRIYRLVCIDSQLQIAWYEEVI